MPEPLFILPQSIEAEQGAIGAMLIEDAATAIGLDTLIVDDFTREAHRIVFQAMGYLHARRSSVDLLTVGAYLQQKSLLDKVGGTLYLTSCMAAVPSTLAIGNYCGIIRAASTKRRLLAAAEEIRRDVLEGTAEIADMVTEAERRILAVGDRDATKNAPARLQTLMEHAFNAYDDAHLGGIPLGIAATPWPHLNELLGTFRAGQLIVIAARPKVGKSALALSLATGYAAQGIPGLLYSLEMDGAAVGDRAMLGTVLGTSIGQDDLSQWGAIDADRRAECLTAFADGIADHWESAANVWVDDRSRLTTTQIDATIRRMKQRHGIQWVIVDYLQLAAPAERRKGLSRWEEMGNVAYELAEVARANGVVMLCCAQLSQAVEQESPARPALHHLAETGKLAMAAHKVIALYRPSVYAEHRPNECERAGYPSEAEYDGLTEVMLLANRSGPRGHRVLWFDGARYRFRAPNAEEWRALVRAGKRGAKSVPEVHT